MNFYTSSQEYIQSTLIRLLSKEYVCDRPNTLIALKREELYGTFPGIFLRSNELVGRTKCLADVKDHIWELVSEDDNILFKRDSAGLAPLHLICSLHSPGQMKIVKMLCTQRSSDTNILDSLSRTPLHHAVSPQNLKYHSECDDGGESLVDLVSLLLQYCADLNAVDFDGVSPLHLVLDFYGSGSASKLKELPNLLRTLVNAGAKPISSSYSFVTPLHLASRLTGPNSEAAIRLFVTKDNINEVDVFENTPLHYAIHSVGNKTNLRVRDGKNFPSCPYVLKKVKLLLEFGADVNAGKSQGMTPLLMALDLFNYTCCLPLVQLLLKNGADVSICDGAEVSLCDSQPFPLHKLCSYFDKNLRILLPLFLEAGGDVNVRDEKGTTPFLLALKSPCCSLDTLNWLIELGANPRLIDSDGNNGLHVLCSSNATFPKEVATLLVRNGCKVNHTNRSRNTPLLQMLRRFFDVDSVRYLVELGANVRARNHKGVTALHLVFNGSAYQIDVGEIVDVLIEAGADLDVQDIEGRTPLHYAVLNESVLNIHIVRRLLAAGADPNVRNYMGTAPLHVVCCRGYTGLAKTLIHFGAEVNSADFDMNTPLHLAQESGEAPSLSQALVEYGADLTAMNCTHETPLALMNLSTYHFLINHKVLLNVKGSHDLNESEKDLIRGSTCYNTHYESSIICAVPMKSHFLGNTTISLVDFLLAPTRKAARYLNNEDVQYDVCSTVERCEYPAYFRMLRRKLRAALIFQEFSRHSKHTMLLVLELPEDVIDLILKHLDEYDMDAFYGAVFEQRFLPKVPKIRHNKCSE